jgi:hypothetical protein
MQSISTTMFDESTLVWYHVVLGLIFVVTGCIQVANPISGFPTHLGLFVYGVDFDELQVTQPSWTALIGVFTFGACVDHLVQFASTLASNHGYTALTSTLDVNYARWAEYALTATSMTLLIAISCGMADVLSLTALVAFRLAMLWSGVKVEWFTSEGRMDLAISAQVEGLAFFLLTWGFLFLQYGMRVYYCHVPGFVHAIVIVLFLCEASFGAISIYSMVRGNKLHRELLYCTASLIAKQSLAWIVYAGMQARSQGQQEQLVNPGC